MFLSLPWPYLWVFITSNGNIPRVWHHTWLSYALEQPEWLGSLENTVSENMQLFPPLLYMFENKMYLHIITHYASGPSSWARLHEFAWFIKLDELYLDREDPWYCHFHESRWIKMVFRPQHSQFLKLFLFKLAQIWLLGVPFHRVSHILV